MEVPGETPIEPVTTENCNHQSFLKAYFSNIFRTPNRRSPSPTTSRVNRLGLALALICAAAGSVLCALTRNFGVT